MSTDKDGTAVRHLRDEHRDLWRVAVFVVLVALGLGINAWVTGSALGEAWMGIILPGGFKLGPLLYFMPGMFFAYLWFFIDVVRITRGDDVAA